MLQVLDERTRQPPVERFAMSGFECRFIASNHYLVTYWLDFDGRHSRRATLWRKTPQGWQALYHQGTLVEHTNEPTRSDG